MNKKNEFQSAVRLALIMVIMGLGVFCALADMPGDGTQPADQPTPMVMDQTPTLPGVTPTPKPASKTPKKRKTPKPQVVAEAETPLPAGPTPYIVPQTPVGKLMVIVPTPTVPPGAQ